MHISSQSGLSRPKLLIVIFVGGLLAITAYMTYAKFQMFAKMGQFSMPPAGVVVTAIAPMSFSDTIEAVGTAMANESANLSARVTETVTGINFTEGQMTTAGTVLVQLSNDEEQAMLTEAQRAFNRADELVKRKAVSVARKDQERMRMDMANAQVNDRQIRAPFDGMLGLRQVSVGDLVSPGTMITTIDDVDPIKLEFSVPETFLSVVAQGMNVEARTEAFSGELFRGAILAVDPRIDPTTRSFRVKAEIPNADLRLKPGLLMSVNIVRNTRDTIAIPEQGLVFKAGEASAMIVGADKKAQVVPVKLGTRRSGFVEILSGLKEGDKVIVEGLVKTQPGAEVNIVGTKTITDFITDATAFAVPGKQTSLKTLETQTQQEAAPIKTDELQATPIEVTPPATLEPTTTPKGE